MLKDLRNHLHERLGYALAGYDWKTRPIGKVATDSGIEARPIHGIFTPIFNRYHDMERRKPSPLLKRVDDLLFMAGGKTVTNVSLMNLNIAIFSAVQIIDGVRGDIPGPVPEELLQAFEDEWAYWLRRSDTLGPKAPIDEQIGNPTERQAFLIHHGTPSWGASNSSDLYFYRAKVFGFLLAVRVEQVSVVDDAARTESGDFLWRWAYGRLMETQLARVTEEMRDLAIEITRDNRRLYRVDEGDKQTIVPAATHTIPCPGCRSPVPMEEQDPVHLGRCSHCKVVYRIVVEPNGVHISKVQAPAPGSKEDHMILNALSAIGIQGVVSPASIKLACANRVAEYETGHIAISPRLRAAAEQDLKEITAGIEVLTWYGYLVD